MAEEVAAFFAAFELEDVGCELLGEGGCAFAFALEVFEEGADDADGVDGAVLIEAFVFAGEDGFAEGFGDLGEGDDLAFFAVDAVDFLAEAVEDEGAFRHGVDAVEVVLL